MKTMSFLLTMIVGLTAATIATAADRTIKLSVPGMYCATCPFIVEQTISRLEGVKSVAARLEDRTAVVLFDDAITSIDVITQATLDVGYESVLMEPAP